MKFYVLAFFLFAFFFLSSTPSLADTTTASNSALPTQEDQTTAASQTITSIKNFIVNLDQIAGGFVFATPADLFNDTVHLQGGTAIGNLNVLRNIFLAMSVPETAILILWVGGFNMMQGTLNYLKPFFGRIIYFVVLALMIPLFLSTTIKIENSLTTSILNAPVLAKPETDITSFSSDMYTKELDQINSGKSTPESLGVANVGWTDFFSNTSHALMVVVLALVTLLVLLLGILFILTQFGLRFLGLLFLSLVYPLVLPLVITKKTEGMFYSYLKIWFTFLIHQPAFALGYMMVMMIARNILDTQGVSLGLIFLYVVSLFFLGTINVLAARIFADAWIALGANLEAAGIARVGNGVAWFGWQNKGAIWNGAKSVGNRIRNGLDHVASPPKRTPSFSFAASPVVEGQQMLPQGFKAGVDTVYGNPPKGYTPPTVSTPRTMQPTVKADTGISTAAKVSSYAKEFNKKGFFVKQTDSNNGIYSVSGTGYGYYDAKNNISHVFPSKRDGLDNGYREDQLRKITISKRNIIDPSHFQDKIPHNQTATIQAQKQGYKSNYAHITKRSDAVRIKHNLEMNEEKFKNLGVHGYMTKHLDNPSGKGSSRRAATRIVMKGEIT